MSEEISSCAKSSKSILNASSIKKSPKQQSILQMFTRKPKRKASGEDKVGHDENKTVTDEAIQLNGDKKRLCLEKASCDSIPENISVDTNKENIEPAESINFEKDIKVHNKRKSNNKCQECRQLLSEIKLFPGDPPGAQEEYIVLTHDSLALFVGNEETGRPQHKITEFTIYDKNTHICSFDGGLIERNIELFFSGFVKAVYDDDPSAENGICAQRLGPINEWFTAGFDGGERALVGFSTAFADYFLMEPSEIYKYYWLNVQEKIYMSKIVIEFLSDNPAAVYEDLLNRIQMAVPPQSLGLTKFTEDSLLKHAQFVVEQIESYDSARAEEEDSLVGTPCMRDLIHLAGVTLGKRRAVRRGNIVKEKKHIKASSTKATTTHLVAEIMEKFFKGTVDSSTGSQVRRRRCGVCEACMRPECGKCAACRDMVKFGGEGRAKQTCVQRRCPNLGIELDDEATELECTLDDVKDISMSPFKAHKVKKNAKVNTTWPEESLLSKDNRTYFASVKVHDIVFEVGDCCLVLADLPGNKPYIGRLISLWQDERETKNEKMAHVNWFMRATDTVLQETAQANELFVVDECEDVSVKCFYNKVDVFHFTPHPNWFFQGGMEDERKFPTFDGKESFYYQKCYDPVCARFTDPPDMHIPDEADYCPSCDKKKECKRKSIPVAKEEIKRVGSKVYYKHAEKGGVNYSIGDSVYLPIKAFSFCSELRTNQKKQLPKRLEDVDEEEYPEYYRKGGYVKGSNETVAEPYRIARIISIYCNNINKSGGKVKMVVTKFYRPENTHKDLTSIYYCDLNMLYWSDEEITLDFELVEGKCFVECECDLNVSPVEYSRKGPDRFYFSEAYDYKQQTFSEPPFKSRRAGLKQMIQKGDKANLSKITKLTKLTKENFRKNSSSTDVSDIPFQKLRTLDVFSGCGGLSEGFHQAGIAETCYAIELWEPAAQAYRLNNPGTKVFTEDCNVLLEMVMSGKEKSNCGQTLPQKGDVELLCGGPPCQGFSGMNRFNSREYSRFKNSLVVSYLSYCDYYRPRFFLLENVRNFVSYKNCMVLKLALASLLRMGYQCTFGILQAGHYGVAQTRRRAIILAAAPGEKLPLYPEPLHTFSSRSGSLSAQIGEQKYTSNIQRINSAPFRTITVRDTMSDLPKIPNGHSKLEMSYRGESESNFQREIRAVGYHDVLRDHICKEMSPLVEARISLIPLLPGSDWRDLPNKVVKLSDGNLTKLLRYDYYDRKQGKSSKGYFRGVCSCAEGKACDPLDRQFNTLVPWCLPHTGNRHNNWAGLYGRLEWNGFFSTTVTNPEPMGKQGRVLHPEQNRVVSVRECARSQGFPDTYRFFGTVLDKHREVGNAVPPPMAKHIGLEIKKCLQWKAMKNNGKHNVNLNTNDHS